MCRKLNTKTLEQFLEMIGNFISISITDQQGKITSVSKAFSDLTGYKEEELLGKTHIIIKHPETQNIVYKTLWNTITKGNTWYGRFKNQTKNQQIYWVESVIQPIFEEQEIVAYIAIQKNITNELAFEKLAKIDSLTNLLNRYTIEEEIHFCIQEAKRYNLAFSIIMVDIDYFKKVNDYHGHLIGDQVLKTFANLLQETFRETDKIGRWGGEEFMILLPHTLYEQAIKLAERFRKLISTYNFASVGHKTASFGVAQYKEQETLTTFINRADQSLYLAKQKGRDKVC